MLILSAISPATYSNKKKMSQDIAFIYVYIIFVQYLPPLQTHKYEIT